MISFQYVENSLCLNSRTGENEQLHNPKKDWLPICHILSKAPKQMKLHVRKANLGA